MSKPTSIRVLLAHTLSQLRLRVFLAVLTLLVLTPVLTAVYSITRAGTDANNTAYAVSPTTLNFQARILNASGSLVPDGTYNIEFKIYNASTSSGSSQGSCTGDANCLWTETRTGGNKVQVKNGYFSAYLGDVTSLPTNIWNQQLWLTMNIGGSGAASWDGEMTPRIRLTSVPFAFRATVADSAETLSKNTGSFTGTVDFANLTADRKYIFPDTSLATTASPGTICVFNGAASNCPAASGSAYYIQNDTVLQSAANFNIQARDSGVNGTVAGVFRGAAAGQTVDLLQFQATNGTVLGAVTAGGNLQVASSVDVRSAGTLSVGTSTATAITVGKSGITTTIAGALTVNEAATFNDNVTVAASKYLKLTGGNTASRPTPTTEGMLYYDTSTHQLLTSIYNSDTSSYQWKAAGQSAVLVAASNSSDADKAAADYVADGTGDQVEINYALTKGSGGRVYLFPGTYVANATILIPNNTVLSGAGRGTLIELADLDATDNLIENSDTTTGTGVRIQDLRLDGRNDLNTAGTQYGIVFNGMGAGSGASARPGGVITGITTSNFRNYGVYITASPNNVITNNRAQGNTVGGFGIDAGSNYTTFTSNSVQGSGYGLVVGTSSNTITGNNIQGHTNTGIYFVGGQNNTISGNNISGNAVTGIALTSGSNFNTVSGNKIFDSGGAATNNGIYVSVSDSNTIVGNNINDSSATTNNYAINIFDNTSDTNYLSNNTLGNGSINDGGTGTVYGGQNNGTSFVIQPGDDFAITGNAASTISTTAGNLTLQAGSGTVTLGSSTTLTATGALSITSGGANALSLDAGGAAAVNIGGTNATSIILGRSGGGTIRVGQNGGTVQIDGTNFDVSTVGVVTLAGGQTNDITTQANQNLTINANGTGTVVLNDTVTVAGTTTFSGVTTDITTGTNEDLTIDANGTGRVVINDNVDISASTSLATKVGTTFTTPGVSNNAALNGAGFYLLDTSGAAQVINGITAGRDGQQLTLTNVDAANTVTLSNNSGSATGSKIITGTGADVAVAVGGSVNLIYDSANTFWRVVGSSASSGGYIQNQNSAQQTGATFWIQNAGRSDTSFLAPLFDTASATALNIGTSTATNITIGHNAGTFAVDGTNFDLSTAGVITLAGGQAVDLTTQANQNLTIQANGTGTINLNDTVTVSGSMTFSGVATDITTGANEDLTIDANGTGSTLLNDDVVVATGKYIKLVGGNTGSRPASPTEGMLYFDTDTHQLLQYNGTKWVSDRSTATKIVAASNAPQAVKDAADYVANGTTDQNTINAALTAAAGGKVYLTEGTFTTTGTILIPDNTTLIGSGANTIIKLNVGAGTDNLIENQSPPSTGVSIRDIQIDGSLGTGGVQNGIFFDQMDGTNMGSQLIGLVSTGWTNGNAIKLTNSTTVMNVSNNLIDTFALDNALVVNFVNNTSVATLTASNNASLPTVTGNTFNTVSFTDSAVFAFNGNYVGNLSATNSALVNVTGNMLASITLNLTSNANISSNVIGNSGTDGISITNSDGVHVVNNRIIDDGGTGVGIHITDALSDATYIAGNDTGGMGINDLGTGTIYGGQTDNLTNFVIQPAGNVNLNADTNIIGNLVASGDGTFNGGDLTVATATANNDKIAISISTGGAASFTGTLTNSDLTAARTWTFQDATGVVALGTAGNSLFFTTTGPTNVTLPTSGTLCSTTSCGTAGGGYVQFAPGTVQADGTNNNSIYINKTSGTGNIIELQKSGVDVFAIDNTGNATFNQNVTIAADKYLKLTGGNTASRPASPTEGMVYFDTTTKQLLIYANGKWQADRSESIIVAASNSSQAVKDAADYVASGTADQNTINAALTAGAGGKVFLAEGTFTTDNYIYMPDDTILAGAGTGTVIQFANLAGGNKSMISTVGIGGMVVRDLKLDGRSDLNASGSQIGIDYSAVSWQAGNLNGGSITNVEITRFRSYGIKIDFSSEYVTVTGNTLVANARGLYIANTSTNNTITGNTFFNNTADALYVTGSSNNIISNNSFDSNFRGIYLTGATNNTVAGNSIYNSTNEAVSLAASANNNTISGNNFSDSGGATTNNAVLLMDSDTNSIVGNTITDSSATSNNYAISLGNAADDNNYLANNTLGGGTINDAAGGDTIYGGQSNGTTYKIQPGDDFTITGNAASTVNTTAGDLTLQAGSGTVTLGSSTTLTATGALSITSGGANALSLDAGGAAAINIGGTSATSIVMGRAGGGTIRVGQNGGTVQIDGTNFDVSTVGVVTLAGGQTADITTQANQNLTVVANGTGTIVLNDTVTVAGTMTFSGPSPDITTGTNENLTIDANGTGITKILDDVEIGGTTLTFTSGANQTVTVAQSGVSGQSGRALTVVAGQANGSGAAAAGGVLTLQGGAAAGTGNANGGAVTIVGGAGTGTGTQGLVNLATSAFTSAGEQSFASSTSITAGNVDLYSSLPVKAITNTGSVLTVPDPAQNTIGRLLYVAARSGSIDFTLRLNSARTPIDISMKQNSTATLIWNGTDWTAAGASSSTDLQAAYNNTLTSAGGAELVLNAPGGNADGLTIRNNATTPIVGGLLEVQTSTGSNLLTVNNNATEYALNGGAESGSGTSFTNGWTASPNGGTQATVARETGAGNFVTGIASVKVTAGGASTNQGAADQIAVNGTNTALTANLTYTVSFAVKGTSNFSTLDVVYSKDGTNSATTTCATGKTVTQSVWSRITCTFTAPSSGITSSNAIFIRQSDAVSRIFYIDNLSVNVNANTNHAVDGDADSAANIGAGALNWAAVSGSTVTQSTSTIYNTAGSVSVATAATAGRGVYNKLSNNIVPTSGTQYRVSFYARGDGTNTANLAVAYTPDNGTSSVSCLDYNTQTVAASSWTLINCYFTATGAVTNAQIRITQTSGSATTFYVDALTVTLNSNNANNVQVGGANTGGPTTLLTLDRSSSAPIAANNDAYLGSMYYDTTTGRIQCYEADGWGACGSSPDNIITLTPEYPGAVLGGPGNVMGGGNQTAGIGVMTSEFCSNQTGILVAPTSGNICASGEARNFYHWTSPQTTEQIYSIYVVYKLPTTFKAFNDSNTIKLTALSDNNTNAIATLQVFRKNAAGTAVTACGNTAQTINSTTNTWQQKPYDAADETTCSFSGGDNIIFKIDMKSKSNGNIYVENLDFVFTNN